MQAAAKIGFETSVRCRPEGSARHWAWTLVPTLLSKSLPLSIKEELARLLEQLPQNRGIGIAMNA